MNKKNINDHNLPGMRLNKSLNKYKDKVLFPEKVAKANEMLKNTKLPDKFYNNKNKES